MRNGLTAALVALLLVLSGCVTLPRHVHKTWSESLVDPGATRLGQIVAADASGKHLSGIRLLSSGEEALASLIALADHAERTLDIQYYIIHEDQSTRVLMHHVRLAADRGVRVRVLVDDLNTVGEDRRFLHLSEHANVEVRLFNPFPGGRFAMWTRIVVSAADIPRINHRMHNKLFVADNAIAITGGRNIGDPYFMRDPRSNFIDLDVVAAGEIVPELSATFDAFWNSKYAYPIASLASTGDSEASGQTLIELGTDASANWLAHELEARALRLTWVPASVVADKPGKIASEIATDEVVTIASNIKALMLSAQHELVIISPYFIPGKDGIAMMRVLTERGVRVRVLTNSLASTDSPLVHIGYSRYRVAMLQMGVELHEVEPKLGQTPARFHPFSSSNASLHAKALVIDQRMVFVGSMNMDARSATTNSELGLIMRSGEIAKQVIGLLDDISTDGSYALRLQGRSRSIEWVSGDPGNQQVWHKDPQTTRWQRIALTLLTPIAPEEFL